MPGAATDSDGSSARSKPGLGRPRLISGHARASCLPSTPSHSLASRTVRSWRKLTAVAHTVPYDLSIMRGTQGGKSLPQNRWSALRAPNLVLDGGKSPVWMRHGCQALATLLPRSSYRTLPGQTHMVKPEVLAPALIEFLAPAA